jgi:hypothetical protein
MPAIVDPLSVLSNLYGIPLKPGGVGTSAANATKNPNAPWLEVLAPPDAGGTGVAPQPGSTGPALIGNGGGVGPTTSPKPGGGVFAPFGSSSSDGPPMWLAKNALAAYQAGNTKYRDHLLADPTIAGDPHLHNFIVGLFNGDPDRIKEAQYYSTNPSYNGWNNAAGNGIPGDGL